MANNALAADNPAIAAPTFRCLSIRHVGAIFWVA